MLNTVLFDMGGTLEDIWNNEETLAAVMEQLQAMLREGVIIRPLTSQGAPQSIRITIGLPEENRRAVQALKKVLGR